MSLPLTRSTTYVAGTTPSIKSADLNDIQDGIADAYSATKTLKALKVDGTGGVAATPVAGAVEVTASAAGGTVPTPTTTANTIYKELIPVGWATVQNSAGTYTLTQGVNISSVTKTGTGRLTVAVVTAPASGVLGVTNGWGNNTQGNFQTAPGVSSVDVLINVGGVATDLSFTLILFGY